MHGKAVHCSVCIGILGTQRHQQPPGRPRPVHIDCVCNSAASSARMWRVLPGSQPLTVLCADTVHSFTLLSSHVPALSMSTCSRSDRTTAYCVCTGVPTVLRSARSVLYSLARTLASCQSLQTHTQTNKQTDRQTLIVACCCGPGWRASERASSAISIRRCFPTSCSLSATFPAGQLASCKLCQTLPGLTIHPLSEIACVGVDRNEAGCVPAVSMGDGAWRR